MNTCKDEINDEEKVDGDSDKPPSINSKSTSSDSLCQYNSSNEKSKKKTIEDFDILYTLGKGSYAKVVLGQHFESHQLYAIKNINKRFVEKVNHI